MESISLAVERYFAPREATDVLEQRRSRLRTIVKSILDRAERKLTALIKQREDARADLALRTHGELLLTYQPNFEPGQTSVTLHDYVADQAVKIAVDARLSAVANAQRLFDRYAKAKRAGEALKPQIDATQLDVEFGRQALTDVSLCDSAGELVRLEAELGEAGYLERRQQAGLKRKGAARPGERKGQRKPVAAGSEPESLKIDGFEVLFGKSSLTNDHLTFRVAAKQDVWLHAKGVPGSHVVVRSAGRQPPPGVVHQAAALAAYLSASRGAAKADVDWTAVANVRRQPGAKPGLVYYDGERTLVVAPQAPTALVPASQEGSSEHERSR
jgi:predicted ribosome quality control (RQC) complex YloA/Tae2 family protein